PNGRTLLRKDQVARSAVPWVAARRERQINDQLGRRILGLQNSCEGGDGCGRAVVLCDHQQYRGAHLASGGKPCLTQRGAPVPSEGAARLIHRGTEDVAAAEGEYRDDSAKRPAHDAEAAAVDGR